MKKKDYLLICLIIVTMTLIPRIVFAHPGGLDSNGCHYCRTNCTKWGLEANEYHCHSGSTYSNSKGEVYDKSGSKIGGGTASNNNSTEKDESVNNNTSIQETPSNDNSGSSNNSATNVNPETSTTKPTTPNPVEKNNNTSLKMLKVDDKEISIQDQMVYETNKKIIEINIEAADNKANVEFDNPELIIGKNVITIKVTAEAGNYKEYKLIVTRKEIKSDVILKKFVLGASEVEFENNKATIKKLTNESSFEYSYELSDKSAKLLLYINDKEVTQLNNIKNEDIIKLVVVDADDNKNIYEIEVTEASKTESAIINAIAYTIVVGIFLAPLIIVGIIIYIKKRKK